MIYESRRFVGAVSVIGIGSILYYISSYVGIESPLWSFFLCSAGFVIAQFTQLCANYFTEACSSIHYDDEEETDIVPQSLPDAPVLIVSNLNEANQLFLNRKLMPGYVRQRHWRNDEGEYAEAVVVRRIEN